MTEYKTETTVTDNGTVMQSFTIYDNGIKVTEWCAVGRSSIWPPVYNPLAGMQDAAAQSRDKKRSRFEILK